MALFLFFSCCEKRGIEVLQAGTALRHQRGEQGGTLHEDVGSEGPLPFEFLQHV